MSDRDIALFIAAALIYAQRKSPDYTPAYALKEARALLDLVLEAPEHNHRSTTP